SGVGSIVITCSFVYAGGGPAARSRSAYPATQVMITANMNADRPMKDLCDAIYIGPLLLQEWANRSRRERRFENLFDGMALPFSVRRQSERAHDSRAGIHDRHRLTDRITGFNSNSGGDPRHHRD